MDDQRRGGQNNDDAASLMRTAQALIESCDTGEKSNQ